MVIVHFLLRNASKKLVYCLLPNTQLVGHLPTAISKAGLSYGKKNIATNKYH